MILVWVQSKYFFRLFFGQSKARLANFSHLQKIYPLPPGRPCRVLAAFVWLDILDIRI